MNILSESIARGMFPVSASATPLARKAYGVLFTAAGTFTAVTESGDSVSLTVIAGQTIRCIFSIISAAPAGTFGYKLS